MNLGFVKDNVGAMYSTFSLQLVEGVNHNLEGGLVTECMGPGLDHLQCLGLHSFIAGLSRKLDVAKRG